MHAQLIQWYSPMSLTYAQIKLKPEVCVYPDKYWAELCDDKAQSAIWEASQQVA